MLADLILKNLKPVGHGSRMIKSQTFLCLSYPLKTSTTRNIQWNRQMSKVRYFCSFAFTLHPSKEDHRQNKKPSIPSTQDGAALVVPATCPGKQEHLTVWDLSSILFLLQHRCAAMTSQVPAFTWTERAKKQSRKTIPSTLHEVSPKSVTRTNREYLEVVAG